MATPGCLDAGDLDESLRELVAQYPGRWNIIKSRLQSQYVLSSFTTASLEQRWKDFEATARSKSSKMNSEIDKN